MHRLLIALASIPLVACSMGSVSDVADSAARDGEAAWVYYPRTEVYRSASVGLAYRQSGDRWMPIERLDPFDLDGRSYLVEETGAEPWSEHSSHRVRFAGEPGPMEFPADDDNGHSWVYYPTLHVFACQRHNHSFRAEGGHWAEADLRSRLDGTSTGYQLGYCGPEPYVHAWIDDEEMR